MGVNASASNIRAQRPAKRRPSKPRRNTAILFSPAVIRRLHRRENPNRIPHLSTNEIVRPRIAPPRDYAPAKKSSVPPRSARQSFRGAR